ncbi:MAG: hypothetical protein CL678_14385 [Bdellovibrionaceae bacterium]|nr:hypothetical protein [Pseudobdellovibrionaceae bacterium]
MRNQRPEVCFIVTGIAAPLPKLQEIHSLPIGFESSIHFLLHKLIRSSIKITLDFFSQVLFFNSFYLNFNKLKIKFLRISLDFEN